MPSVKTPSARYHQSNKMWNLQNGGGSSGNLVPPRSPYVHSPSASGNGLGGVRVTKEEADTILQELAKNDDDTRKTWSRIVVDKYLSKVRLQ